MGGQSLTDVFAAWDTTKSGLIRRDELTKLVVRVLKEPNLSSDVDKMITAACGSDGDIVDWRKFLDFLGPQAEVKAAQVEEAKAAPAEEAPKSVEIKADVKADAPKARSKGLAKGSTALLKGLKSGEVGRLVDGMEAKEAEAAAAPKATASMSNPDADKAILNATDIDELKAALALGGNVNELGQWGRTALVNHASQGTLEMVQLLLAQAGIQVDLADEDGNTPLTCAAANTRLETVKALVEAGADVNVKAGEEKPLTLAKKSQCDTKEETIAYLTSKGATL